MFRAVLFVFGVVLLVGAAVAAIAGWPAIPLAVFGAILVLALLFERYIYKPIRPEPPGAGWERTAEQFADPHSGQRVTVYFNPRTGERRYVADGNG
jgi:fatty acid desaturase